MPPLVFGALCIVALFALIILQVPIAFALIAVGVAGFASQEGWHSALQFLASEPAALLSTVDLSTLPLFLIMATVVSIAGFSDDMYSAATAFIGHRRGGLAYATVGACAAFGAICGSTTATAATFGKIALPAMLRRGYSPQFASGTIAAAGTLKSLIPPSLVMILYCIVSKTFIFDMFTAAIIPALLTIALNMIAIYISVWLNPKAAPVSQRLSWRERSAAAKNAIPALALLLAVFGGLYGGVFTIVEAASVAAVLSLVFALAGRRMSWTGLLQGLYQAAASTVMLYMILIGASVFTYCLTLARVPEALVEVIGNLDAPPFAVIVLLMIAYIILGTVFEELSAILITLPVVLPIVVHLGYDPIWWGVLNVVQVELAMIHPPMGIVVFLLHGLAPDIPMRTIYRGVVPFIIADFAVLVLLMVFPAIALWLPHVLAR